MIIEPQSAQIPLAEAQAILNRAKSIIEAETHYRCRVIARSMQVDGVYTHLVGEGVFTTPFTLPSRVREILKELNEF